MSDIKSSDYKLHKRLRNDDTVSQIDTLLKELTLASRSPIYKDDWFKLEFIRDEYYICFSITKKQETGLDDVVFDFRVGKKLLDGIFTNIKLARSAIYETVFSTMITPPDRNDWVCVHVLRDNNGDIFLMVSTATMEAPLFALNYKKEGVKLADAYGERLFDVSGLLSNE